MTPKEIAPITKHEYVNAWIFFHTPSNVALLFHLWYKWKMLINVTCPGCLKRFRVGERFAGRKGPCPNCGAIIPIPAETPQIPKAKDGLIQRQNMEFDPDQAKFCAWGVLGVLLLTFLLGCVPMYAAFRSILGVLGLCFLAFPLALFGYHVLRDREEIFAFSGEELHRRAGMVATGYVVLWLGLECFLAAARAEVIVSGLYFTAFAVLATLLACSLLELKLRDAFLHFCTFAFTIIFLRFLFGLGWFWSSSELIRRSTAPPPPFLPGM